MKILVYALTETLGGIESFLIKYCTRLAENKKIEFDFISVKPQVACTNDIQKMKAHIYYFPTRRDSFCDHYKVMDKFFRDHASDYNAVWFNANDLSDIGFLKLSRKYNIPVRICHSHNSGSDRSIISKIFHLYNRYHIMQYATDFWACSIDAAKWLFPRDLVKSNQITIVHNAIEADKFQYNPVVRQKMRQKLGIDNKFVIGHVGRFQLQKNHDYLIDIFQAVHLINKNSVLILIGDSGLYDSGGGLRKKIEKRVKELELEDVVLFLGSRNDVHEIMQAMDVFVFPSLFEGLGIVLIEAQAAGLPVIASDAIPIEAECTNLLYRINLTCTPSEWAEKILKHALSKRENTYTQIVRNGYNLDNETIKLQKLIFHNEGMQQHE